MIACVEIRDFPLQLLLRREPGFEGTFGKADRPPVHPAIRAAFAGPLVLNSDFVGGTAQAALDAGEADAIAFGRTFLANPDLVERFARNAPLNEVNVERLYGGGSDGYSDYPALAR